MLLGTAISLFLWLLARWLTLIIKSLQIERTQVKSLLLAQPHPLDYIQSPMNIKKSIYQSPSLSLQEKLTHLSLAICKTEFS